MHYFTIYTENTISPRTIKNIKSIYTLCKDENDSFNLISYGDYIKTNNPNYEFIHLDYFKSFYKNTIIEYASDYIKKLNLILFLAQKFENFCYIDASINIQNINFELLNKEYIYKNKDEFTFQFLYNNSNIELFKDIHVLLIQNLLEENLLKSDQDIKKYINDLIIEKQISFINS